jgi:O-antigen ligase
MVDPVWHWIWEALVLGIAAVTLLVEPLPGLSWEVLIPLSFIGIWGFGQLALESTAYRYRTLEAAVRFASYAAAALLGAHAWAARERWLRWFAWFAAALAVVSVLAYHTSSYKILWLVSSPYPDNWGPFSNRNNFAQFLELAFPVAMYRFLESSAGQTEDTDRVWARGLAPALILAAGVASASRAGALLLALEALIFSGVLLRAPRASKRRGRALFFTLAVLCFVALMGSATLLGRLKQPDPLSIRREIFQASIEMVRAHPWAGFGLGTFGTVYPEFAQFDPGSSVEHAHSDWLEWPAEGGLLFTLPWGVLAWAVLRRAARSIWGLGVVATLVHAGVDYPFARFGVAVWFFVLCGMLAVAGRGFDRRHKFNEAQREGI